MKKGFRYINASGYVEINVLGRGYMLEHRHVMEQQLGRQLTKEEVVYHIDRNKQNNNPSNLRVMTNREHLELHLREDKRQKQKGRKRISTTSQTAIEYRKGRYMGKYGVKYWTV